MDDVRKFCFTFTAQRTLVPFNFHHYLTTFWTTTSSTSGQRSNKICPNYNLFSGSKLRIIHSIEIFFRWPPYGRPMVDWKFYATVEHNLIVCDDVTIREIDINYSKRFEESFKHHRQTDPWAWRPEKTYNLVLSKKAAPCPWIVGMYYLVQNFRTDFSKCCDRREQKFAKSFRNWNFLHFLEHE